MAVVGVDMAVVDSSDDFMEVVSIVGWFVTDVGVEVAAKFIEFYLCGSTL
jgi:hypothetical protein